MVLESIRTVAYDYDARPDIIPRERVEATFATRYTYAGQRVRLWQTCGAELFRDHYGANKVAGYLRRQAEGRVLVEIEYALRDKFE